MNEREHLSLLMFHIRYVLNAGRDKTYYRLFLSQFHHICKVYLSKW